MNPETMTAILSLCGAVITIDKVVDIVIKFKGRATNDVKYLSEKVQEHEAEIDKIHGFLARDKTRLDAMDKGMSVLQKSILALIDNAIDDTDKAPLLDAKKDLNNFLIERGLSI